MEDKVQVQYLTCVQRGKQYIQNYPDRVPPKIIQKLLTLQASIENRQIPNFEQINEIERQQLVDHPIPVKYRMYIDIVGSFMFQENEVKGRLDMKKKSGWFWNNKRLSLNLVERRLRISRNDPKKQEKELVLVDYSLKWVDQVKSRYCFHLCGKQTLIFGSEDFTNAEQWFNYLRQCCMASDDDLLKQTKKFNQNSRQSDDFKQFGKRSEIIAPKENQTIIISKHQKTLSSVQSKPISQQQKQEYNNNQIFNQPKIYQQQQQQQQQDQEQNQDLNQQSVIINENIQQCQELQKNQIPALMQQVINDPSQYAKEILQNDFEYQLLNFKNKLRLLQHKQNPAKIKAVTLIHSDQILTIVSALASPDINKQWNSQIEDILTLDMMPKNNSLIIAEMRKKYGTFYLKRSYTYLRYIAKIKDIYYIFDKSIPHKQSIIGGYQFEGQILLSVIAVIPQQNHTMIVWSTETKNGGYANSQQDAQLTIQYVQELQNLESYLQQKEYKIQMPQFLDELQDLDQLDTKEIIQEQFTQVVEEIIDSDSDINQADLSEFKSQIIQDDEEIESYNILNKNDLLQLIKIASDNPSIIFSSAIHNYKLKPLPPNNIYYTETNDHKNVILQSDWEILQKGGLRFINQRKLEIQKEVITYMLKKLGSNLLAGKSLISISLPVTIFEKRSNLERACYSLGYLWLLEKAGECADPIEQMKLVAQFTISYNISFLNLEKPFNPILGETYQGYMNGNILYCEQVSHHPPVFALYVIGRNFKLTGHLESQANFSANSITGQNYGYLQVEFSNTSIKFNMIPGTITGMTIGHRQFYLNGIGWLVDEKNKLFCDIEVNAFPGVFSKKTTPADFMEGYIIKGTTKELNKFQTETYRKYSGLKNIQSLQKLATISGRWTSGMMIDNVEVINWFKHFPYKLIHEEYPLASDSNYREDLLALKTGDMKLAQEKKEKMEILQRNDKKIRAKKKH